MERAIMVRTRFAPSPTGYLHIGGVRTALFNWLFARKHGGQFILRIDDTDEQRNVQAALQPILDGFKWLGMDWDEGAEIGGPLGPYYQSKKREAYQAAVKTLLDKGLAYWDYSTAPEREAEEKASRAEKQPYWIYSRKWMARTPEQRAKFEGEGRTAAVRLLMPREGYCEFNDHIRGAMKIEWAREQDHVIQRADGSCLYNLATVVDDFDMKITHVIRSEEHLSNTPRQIFIVDSLGYPRPEYAHLPYVAAPGSKEKLSKRKLDKYLKNKEFKDVFDQGQAVATAIGLKTTADTFNPVIVDFYEQVGYLPDAILNYLLLLGWSLDGSTEDFSRADMTKHFSLERVNKAPASFDSKKLLAFQERYMQRLPADDKLARTLPFLQKAGFIPTPAPEDARAKTAAILAAAGDRIKTSGDILDYADFFTADDALKYDEAAFDKRLCKPAEAKGLLTKFRDKLATATSFDPPSLEKLTADFVTAEAIRQDQIIHALRVALTGKGVGFGLYETLAILGKDHCLARIVCALERHRPT